MYSSTICEHVPDNILLNGFADNHTLHKNVAPTINELVAIKKLEKSLEDISELMCLNSLKMNPSVMYGAVQHQRFSPKFCMTFLY